MNRLTGKTASPCKTDTQYAAGERDTAFVQQCLLDSIVKLGLILRDVLNWEANLAAQSNAADKTTAIANAYLESNPRNS